MSEICLMVEKARGEIRRLKKLRSGRLKDECLTAAKGWKFYHTLKKKLVMRWARKLASQERKITVSITNTDVPQKYAEHTGIEVKTSDCRKGESEHSFYAEERKRISLSEI